MGTPTLRDRRPLGTLDVEAIRLPLENELYARLVRDAEVQRAMPGLKPPDLARLRRELLGNGLLLTEAMAPEVHGIARDVQRVLGFDTPFEIFQTTGVFGLGAPNVGVNYAEGDPIIITIMGRVIADEGPSGVAAAFGHEFGHYLAHGPRSPAPLGAEVARHVWQTTARSGLAKVSLAYNMARELTADRIGLLATQDIDALIADMMTLASGLSAAALKGGPGAYLEQARALIEDLLSRGESVQSGTHPEYAARVYAAWLFSQSDLYGKITQSGSGTRSIGSINATLAKLLTPAFEVGTATRTVRFGKQQPLFEDARPGAAPRPPIKKSVVVGDDPWDGARETAGSVIEGASKAIKNASTALSPGFSKLKRATAQGMARIVGRPAPRQADDDPAPEVDDDELGLDPDKELLDRFAELERRMKEKGGDD
jgi:hypothetical protein